MRDNNGRGWSLTLSKSPNNGDIRYNVSCKDSTTASIYHQDTSIPTSWTTVTVIWTADNKIQLYRNGSLKNTDPIAETSMPPIDLEADLIVGSGLQGQIRNIQIEHI